MTINISFVKIFSSWLLQKVTIPRAPVINNSNEQPVTVNGENI
ncbi:hypothetical protein [Nostoc sp. CHAB 5715]|nr:hypothetical protein [Nostoc sp. CHAB 5715]